MTQEKLDQRAYNAYFSERTAQEIFKSMRDFARAELQKAAEIADRYKEPLIADEIRKLME